MPSSLIVHGRIFSACASRQIPTCRCRTRRNCCRSSNTSRRSPAGRACSVRCAWPGRARPRGRRRPPSAGHAPMPAAARIGPAAIPWISRRRFRNAASFVAPLSGISQPRLRRISIAQPSRTVMRSMWAQAACRPSHAFASRQGCHSASRCTPARQSRAECGFRARLRRSHPLRRERHRPGRQAY